MCAAGSDEAICSVETDEPRWVANGDSATFALATFRAGVVALLLLSGDCKGSACNTVPRCSACDEVYLRGWYAAKASSEVATTASIPMPEMGRA